MTSLHPRPLPWNALSGSVLDPGITVLEASAGTGKTYSITSLALRLAAEKALPMDKLVAVTFTNAATAELRDRIRNRLTSVLEQLASGNADPRDEIAQGYVKAGKAERDKYTDNLRRAVETYDQCLICTIHGFCQRILQQYAFESLTEFTTELVTGTADFLEELVDDWISGNLGTADAARLKFLVDDCQLDRASLLQLAREGTREPDLQIVPDPNAAPNSGPVFDQAFWDSEVEKFLKRWRAGLGASLVEYFGKLANDGAFRARTSTYGAKKVAQRAAELQDWLAGSPDFNATPNPLGYWAAEAITGYLAVEPATVSHEGLSAIWKLAESAELAATQQRQPAALERAKIVKKFRTDLASRMTAGHLQSFQDLIGSLARVLSDKASGRGEALARAVRERFEVAFIDEFQDTDADQWGIFRTLFGGGRHRLYLIGDPKQAIYGFRGANVHVYLEAKKAASHVYTMTTNFRSEPRLIQAFNHLMNEPGFFCQPGIEFDNITHCPNAPEIVHDSAPLQLRFIGQHLVTGQDDPGKPVGKGVLNDCLPERVAGDIVEFLNSGPLLGCKPLGPGDIAVLTRTGKQAHAIQSALDAAGVPSVLWGADSVLASDESGELQYWLEALESPGHDGPARAAATTRLFGRTATLLAGVQREDPSSLGQWNDWLKKLSHWRESFEKRHFWATLRQALNEDHAPGDDDTAAGPRIAQLLRQPGGARVLTNVWHLGELLHAAETQFRFGLPGLLGWLKKQRANATVDSETAECRLDRDDAAVAVLTMHKAKGLEFPVVFVPYLWDGKSLKDEGAVIVPGSTGASARVLDVRAPEDRTGVIRAAETEAHREQLRLLYVALTRAKHRCVVYTGDINELDRSPLCPVFHGRNVAAQSGEVDRISAAAARANERNDADRYGALYADVQQVAVSSEGTISLDRCEPAQGLEWNAAGLSEAKYGVRTFAHAHFDHAWRRHSYTSLSIGLASLPQHEELPPGKDNDDDVQAPEPGLGAEGEPVQAQYLPETWTDFYRGAQAGNFFHKVLQLADFEWANPNSALGGQNGERQLRGMIAVQLEMHGFRAESWIEKLTAGLLGVLRTPLGSRLGNTRLCDLPRAARFSELEFDFPIAEGQVQCGGLIGCLRKRADDCNLNENVVTRQYLKELSRTGPIAGFMTGSIDLVFRHPNDPSGKWYVVDYKSNCLHEPRQQTPAPHYDQKGMRDAMQDKNYYLQYHLYLTALHRYLKFRLAGYQDDCKGKYADTIGGAYYLFLRGMTDLKAPPGNGPSDGCFFDCPPAETILGIDDLFDKGSQSGGRL